MKRFLWAAPILFLVATSVCASADSLDIFLIPNNGSGDNFGFLQQQNGITISIGGGTPFGFFNDQGYDPGSVFGGTTSVFFSGGTIQIGNNTFDLGFNGPGSLFLSSFTFPTDGSNLSIIVQANFTAQAYYFDADGQLHPITISGSGHGLMTFNYSSATGLYFAPASTPVVFSAVPEPGTLGLMGTGLLGMLGTARQKFKGRRSS
jgi:hypothetical protein